MFDPSTGTWYLRNEAGPGLPDAGVFRYGAPEWLPVVGDWNGDGTATIGVVDPATFIWYLRNENSAGAPDAGTFQYGGVGWKPVVGDWNGDGITTAAVFDPAGNWYIRNRNSPGSPDVAPFGYGLGPWMPLGGNWNVTLPLAPDQGTSTQASNKDQASLHDSTIGSGLLVEVAPTSGRRTQALDQVFTGM
jgi:hypothetical protein